MCWFCPGLSTFSDVFYARRAEKCDYSARISTLCDSSFAAVIVNKSNRHIVGVCLGDLFGCNLNLSV